MNGNRLTGTTTLYFDNGVSDSSGDESGPESLDYVNVVPQTISRMKTGQLFQNGYEGSSEDETGPEELEFVNVLKTLPRITKGKSFLNGCTSSSDDEDNAKIKHLTYVNNFNYTRAQHPPSIVTKREKDLSHTGVQTNTRWTDGSTLFFNNGNEEEISHSEDDDIKSNLTIHNHFRPDSENDIINSNRLGIENINSNLYQNSLSSNGSQTRLPRDTIRQNYNEKTNGNMSAQSVGLCSESQSSMSTLDNEYLSMSDKDQCVSLTFKNDLGPKASESWQYRNGNKEVTKKKNHSNKEELIGQNMTAVDRQNTITNKNLEYKRTENYQSQEHVLTECNGNPNHVRTENMPCPEHISAEKSQIPEHCTENSQIKSQSKVGENSENTNQSKESGKQELSLVYVDELPKVEPVPDKVTHNTPESVSEDLNKTVETTETHKEGRDIQPLSNIDIKRINKIVERPDIPFRNTFGPTGIRQLGINVFEARLQENNFDKHKTVNNQSSISQQHKTTTSNQTTELSTQILKDDLFGDDNDLEIDGEKSHTFKDPLKEKLKMQSSREKHMPLSNTTTQANVKSTFLRQYSIGAYGHTCSGCGRKDCDGNFMRLLREMIRTGRKKGFEIRNVVPDGNCMFAAVIDQLELLGDCHTSPFALRQSCTQYLKSNPTSQDGTPFDFFIDGESWEDYLSRMGQEGQWGDHLMLQAVSCVTSRTITVINGEDETKWTNIYPAYTAKPESLHLGHVGELHYVSMRPVLYKEMAEDECMSIDLYSPLPSLPNMEDATQQQMFKEDYVDPWCDIPAIHLTFLIKQFIPLKSTIKNADSMCHQAFAIESSTEEYMGQRSDTGREFNIKAIGDVVEGMFAASLDEYQLPESHVSGEWADVGIIYSLTTCIAYPQNMNNMGTIDPSDVSVDTKHTHPGYVRLLARYPDTWGLEDDHSAMSFYIPNNHKKFGDAEGIQRFKDQYASQNPAIVYLFQRMFSGVFSPFWPVEASAWRSRSRNSGWPSPELIDSIVSEGVYYISQPHVNSLNPGIEFQTSFAVAERRLANEGLSTEQRYCFIVFKALISHALMGDDLINSNHLKSIFFQASEVIPQQYWASRMSACILYMVDSLTRQLEFRNLPNYFILTNNMIDHLSSDQIQRIIEKLNNIRTNPVSVLYSIAYQNMVTNADDIFQQIRQDIDDFQQHNSVRQSVIETLVPAKIKQAAKYIEVNNYDIAIEIIQEAHEDRLMVSTCEDNIPFVAFVTEVTNSFGLSKQWWLCLHADETLGTALSTDLSLQHDPIPLKEIVGNDIADSYGELLIPRPLVENLFSFCMDFYLYLILKHKKKKAVAFLVKGREFFLHLQRFGGLPSDFPCTFNTDNYNITNIYKIYKCLVQNFVITMSSEPLCSLRLDEIANEVQNICERVNSEEAYTILVLMWKFLGDTEKVNQASRRLDDITMGSSSAQPVNQ